MASKKYVYVDPRLPVDPTLSTRDPAHPRNIVRNLAAIEEQALADTVYDGPPPQRDTPLIEAYTASPSVGAPAQLASAPVASVVTPPAASVAAPAPPTASHKRRPSRDAVDFRFLRIYGETVLLTVFLIVLVLVLVIAIQNTQSVYVSFLFLPMIALMILFGLRMVIKTHLLD
jgi:uncharacterized integral membrane protein